MKRLFLASTLLFSALSFSQIVSVNVSKTYTFIKRGNLDYVKVLKSPDSTTVQNTNAKYVLDLSKKTSTFYMDGIKINTLKFNTLEKNNNTYVITIKDKNIYDGTLLMSKFTLDITKNLLVCQWYDEYYDLTIVLIFKQTIEISN